MKAKEIFDKQDWVQDLKKQKMNPDVVQAFHYCGDIIEDLIKMVCDQEERIEQLERQLKKHKHCSHSGEAMAALE